MRKKSYNKVCTNKKMKSQNTQQFPWLAHASMSFLFVGRTQFAGPPRSKNMRRVASAALLCLVSDCSSTVYTCMKGGSKNRNFVLFLSLKTFRKLWVKKQATAILVYICQRKIFNILILREDFAKVNARFRQLFVN